MESSLTAGDSFTHLPTDLPPKQKGVGLINHSQAAVVVKHHLAGNQ